MTNIDTTIGDVAPAQRRRRIHPNIASAEHRPALSKSATVIKLLSRAKGASVAELMAVTNWQPHSVRAFLSGLRKKGNVLTRDQRKNGEQAYRIAEAVTASASTAAPAAMPAAASDAVA
jgi:DNA-binding IclR family transcriptional regulator